MKCKVKSNLGNVIKEKGLKSKWICDQIGSSQSQLSNWCNNENGYAKSTPSVPFILRLQKILKVSVDEMFIETD